jgi:hypothetical protein
MRKWLSSALIFSSWAINAQKIQQQVINSSGSSFSNNGITVAFNVGEPITSTLSTNNNVVSQGFIQPIKSDLPTALKEYAALDGNFMLYPNPTNGHINLTLNEGTITLKRVDIYANDDRLVLSRTLSNNSIDVSNLSDGIYWIRPISDEKQFGLKKLVKTH